ncbi:MAG: GFA family protein [Pseudomonadota bacterium]
MTEREPSDVVRGGCLCGAVTVSARLRAPTILACHCTQCQRWTGGGPLFTVRVSDLELSGGEHVGTYHASDWGERAFCKVCGTTLYWRRQKHDIAGIAVGLLHEQSQLTVAMEIYTDHRPDWLPHWAGAGQMTQADIEARSRAPETKETSQ